LNRRVRCALMFTTLTIPLLVAGCSKKTTTAKVEGTVTYQNAPLPVATIIFSDGKGHRASGDVVEGKFSIPNAPLGDEIKVVVSPRAFRENFAKMELNMLGPPPPKDSPKDAPRPVTPSVKPEELEKFRDMQKLVGKLVPVPERYEKEETTPLVFKITAGMSDLSITLEK